MALNIGTQLSLQSVLYRTLLPAPAGASSLGSALRDQLYAEQASLILNRVPSTTRALIYQETLTRQLSLLRSTWPLLSSPGHDPVYAARDFSSTNLSSVRGYAKLWATPQTHAINVLSIDTPAAQQSVSKTFTRTSVATSVGFQTGTNAWTMTIGGTVYNLQTTINTGDTVQTVFTGAAAAFNALSGDPVTATVVNPGGDDIYLQITSNTLGTDAAFQLADATRNFISNSQLGLTTPAALPGTGGVSVYAKDAAQYQIDNGQTLKSATSQRITLDDGAITLWLLKATASPVTVAVTAQKTETSLAVQRFVSAWNASFDFLTTNPGELTTPLAAQLNSAAAGVTTSLGAIGIERGANGQFTVDTTRLESAIDSDLDRLRRLLSAMAIPARRLAEDFLTAPARYVTHPQNPVAAAALRWTEYWDTRGLIINTLG